MDKSSARPFAGTEDKFEIGNGRCFDHAWMMIAPPTDADVAPLLPPQWRSRLASLIFLGGLILIIFDRYAQDLREVFYWALLPAFVLLDLPARGLWGGEPFRRRLRFTLAGIAFSVVLGGLAQLLAARASLVPVHEAWRCLMRYAAPVFWGVSLWLFSPAGLRWIDWFRSRRAGRSCPPPDAEMILHAPLMLFGLWSFMSCMSSLEPERSFYYFAMELGLYVPIILLWGRLAKLDPSALINIKRGAALLLAAGLLTGALIALVYVCSDWEMRQRLEQIRMSDTMVIKIDQEADGQQVWRLSFPFGHHNRMAFFSMSAALVLLMAFADIRHPLIRALAGGAAAVGVIDLLLTLNRGAVLAFAAASAWLLIASLGRRSVLLLIPLGALWFALPGVQRDRIASLARRESYTNPDSTIVTRFEHWHAARIMIADHPFAGIGYGWKNFEKQHEKIARRLGWKVRENHAHNIWLQFGAESGLPAAIFFGIWNLCRWWLAFKLWRGRKSLDPTSRRLLICWIAIDLAIQVYCLGNHPLRRGLGVYTWTLWAAMSAELTGMLRQPPKAAPTSMTPSSL